MNKLLLGSTAALLMAVMPSAVSAYETPIEDNQVPIETIVNHFNGESNMDRDEDGQYYNEYIFNGHIIQIYSGQSIAWVDGETVPFLIEEKDGVLLPKPYRMSNSFSSPMLPAEFFVNNFGYEIDGNSLIFDELPEVEEDDITEVTEAITEDVTETPEEAVETIESPVNDENNPNETEESDTEIDDQPTIPEEPKEAEEKPEEPEEEPVEVGKLNLSADVRNMGLNNSIETGIKGHIDSQEFVAYFENENSLAVHWLNKKHTKTVLVQSDNHTVTFPVSESEFYTIHIDIQDTRNTGLRTETVIRYVKLIDDSIVIHSGNNQVTLTYSNENSKELQDTMLSLENTLSFLGVEQFKLDDTQTDTFVVQFHLHDSSWSV